MCKIVIYTKDQCPFCSRAKSLFSSKNVSFEEISLENKPDEFQKLKAKTKMQTVPQIFINDQLIGGYDSLIAMEKAGKLDPLLK